MQNTEKPEIRYVNMDITSVARGIVAHGANCQLKMGFGVALAIKRKWPIVFEEYAKQVPGAHLLGRIQVVTVKPELLVINCHTQIFYGRNGRYADDSAIYRCMRQVMECSTQTNLPIYVPKIGAGSGGLDWNKEVVPAIKMAADSVGYNRVITVCEV